MGAPLFGGRHTKTHISIVVVIGERIVFEKIDDDDDDRTTEKCEEKRRPHRYDARFFFKHTYIYISIGVGVVFFFFLRLSMKIFLVFSRPRRRFHRVMKSRFEM